MGAQVQEEDKEEGRLEYGEGWWVGVVGWQAGLSAMAQRTRCGQGGGAKGRRRQRRAAQPTSCFMVLSPRERPFTNR